MPLPEPRIVGLADGRRILVRPARARDARGWMELMRRVSHEDRYILLESISTTRAELARLFRVGGWAEQSAAIVAIDGEDLAGQLTATRHHSIYRHTAELGMSVKAELRGKGVGSELVEGAKDWARRFGVEKLVLNVVPQNTRAIRFYEKMGFQTEGYRLRQAKLSYGYEDLVEMSLWVP